MNVAPAESSTAASPQHPESVPGKQVLHTGLHLLLPRCKTSPRLLQGAVLNVHSCKTTHCQLRVLYLALSGRE